MSFIKSTISNAMKQKSVMRIFNASLALLFVTSLALNIASSNQSASAASIYDGYERCVSPNTGETLNLSSDKFDPAQIVVNGNQTAGVYKHPGQCSGKPLK